MKNTTQQRIENLADKLRSRGQRLTPQRMAVLKVLVNNEGHPDMEAIYNEVKKSFPMTSLATIYKTISTLQEVGEVRTIGANDGNKRYDAANPCPHPHLICIKCDKIIDIEVEKFINLSSAVEKQSGYQLVDLRLDFFGICPDCQSTC
jgi:Fur family transcriptional regulator, peroxide stress response regulator